LEFPNICIDKTLSLAEIDKSGTTPKSVMEVAPHQISAYKALKGDHSDFFFSLTTEKHRDFVGIG
jgi:hypothetical protein